MKSDMDDLACFHLLRRPLDADLPAASELIPAQLAPFRDLPALRHDYPLVLTDDPPTVVSLTDVTNRALRSIAPRGPAGERLRQRVLRVETEVRRLLAAGHRGWLGELWDDAARQLLAEDDDERLRADIELARAKLDVDGRLVDCDEDAPSHAVTHLWSAMQRDAARSTRRRIDELILGLSGILDSHVARSDEGRSPARLSASLGGDHRNAFDFDEWSAILGRAAAPPTISDIRRTRIRSTLSVLEAQRFFPPIDAGAPDPVGTYPFRFRSCVAAAAAYHERVPAMVELVKAMAIAELELQNGYREAECDPYFDGFDEGSLTPADLALFPSYLVCLADDDLAAGELAQTIRALGSPAPIKVLVEVRDVLGEPGGGLPLANGAMPSAAVGRHLGPMAMATGAAFVLQTASSHLARVVESIERGLAAARPALFSIFTGSAAHVPSFPAYLVAAAAIESRAVPSFVFDPDAGSCWADRFDIGTNPDPEEVWPAGIVPFADADMQSHVAPAAFTLVEFAALDGRYAPHLTIAPPHTWSDDMRTTAEVIGDRGTDVVPYLLMATGDDVLHRVVVDHELIRTAREYADAWRSLQELAGIGNSHAIALVAAERVRWKEEEARQTASAGHLGSDLTATTAGPSAAPEAGERAAEDEPVDDLAGEEPPPEGAYIETARCTTCDECTDLNPRMFAYDDNKQAYIADLSAGTYREMVEAAEACQVAIIHPGPPWDPSEPDLDELVARAAEFA